MAKLKVLAGDFKPGDYNIDSFGLIASVEIQTEQQAKNFLASTASAVGGAVAASTVTGIATAGLALVFPPLAGLALVAGAAGLIGGAMAGGNKKILCVLVKLHSDQQFLAVVDAKCYQQLYSKVKPIKMPPRNVESSAAPLSTPRSENKYVSVECFDSGTAQTAENKKCPDCAEMIKAEALKCRFCGFRFLSYEEFIAEMRVQLKLIRQKEEDGDPAGALQLYTEAIVNARKHLGDKHSDVSLLVRKREELLDKYRKNVSAESQQKDR